MADQLYAGQDFEHDSSDYPSTRLLQRLRTISGLIKSGFSTPVYYAIQPGYDTHAAQLSTHSRLLRELGDAVKAFLDDMRASRLADHVVVMAFSEFGRQVAENASAGTDHGAAGPVFVAGDPIRGGLLGSTAKLSDLKGRDLPMAIDFRSIYASLATGWLGAELPPEWLLVPKLDGLV